MMDRYIAISFFSLAIFLLIYLTSFHLVILTLCLLLSLLIVFKSPTYKLWHTSVVVSEYCFYFCAITILFLLTSIYATSYRFLATAIGLIATIIFLSPIVRAQIIARYLLDDLKKAFRKIDNSIQANNRTFSEKPFNLMKCFQGVSKIKCRSFTYVTYDDTTLTLDYYESIIAGKRPCLIVIHGGSWCAGNSKQLPELNYHLSRAGYHCVAINYRLAPKWKCPAPIEDVSAALTYLCGHADELKIDTDNFVLLGRSAGAQIGLLAAYTLQQFNIKGVVNFYGPADMIWGYKVPTSPHVINSTQILIDYVGGKYPEIEDKYIASSPIEFVNDQTVPTMIFHGQTDSLVFVEHAHRLTAKLKAHNVPHYLLDLPWATHGFDYHLNGPGGQLSTYAIEYFLHVVTSR